MLGSERTGARMSVGQLRKSNFEQQRGLVDNFINIYFDRLMEGTVLFFV